VITIKKRKICRGDIYRVNFDPVFGSEQGGCRPAVILQNNRGNIYSPTVIIAAITSRHKSKMPTHVIVDDITEAGQQSVILLEQIRTIDKKRLEDYICTLSDEDMERVNKAICFSMGIKKKRKSQIE